MTPPRFDHSASDHDLLVQINERMIHVQEDVKEMRDLPARVESLEGWREQQRERATFWRNVFVRTAAGISVAGVVSFGAFLVDKILN